MARRAVLDTIADVDASRIRPGPVVITVTPPSELWEAEPEHQDHVERYPAAPATSSDPAGALPARTQTTT